MHNLNLYIEVTAITVLVIVAVTLGLYIIIESQRRKLPKPLLVVRIPYDEVNLSPNNFNPTLKQCTERALHKFSADYNIILIECDVESIEMDFVVTQSQFPRINADAELSKIEAEITKANHTSL